jgi:predicted nucleic acid-binding protein
MDLADATLVALAEARGFRRIFSLGSDFLVYRTRSGKSLKVVP